MIAIKCDSEITDHGPGSPGSGTGGAGNGSPGSGSGTGPDRPNPSGCKDCPRKYINASHFVIVKSCSFLDIFESAILW